MKKERRTKIIYLIIYFIFILVIAISTTYIFKMILLNKEAIEESQLLNNINMSSAEKNVDLTEEEGENISINKEKQIKEQKESVERILKLKKLQEINYDIIAWIEIEGTNINYPVLQGKDNDYYLTHNYKKQKTEKGSIFLDSDYDWTLPSTNLLIYGHNLINGQMFKDLLKYSDEEFYKKHPIIRFTTNNKDTEFEIISVFKSRVYYKNEKNVFRYYDFINANTEKEYNRFVKNAKEASIYNINKTAKYGDQLITLVTCSYHTENGRFVVIGREK